MKANDLVFLQIMSLANKTTMCLLMSLMIRRPSCYRFSLKVTIEKESDEKVGIR